MSDIHFKINCLLHSVGYCALLCDDNSQLSNLDIKFVFGLS